MLFNATSCANTQTCGYSFVFSLPNAVASQLMAPNAYPRLPPRPAIIVNVLRPQAWSSGQGNMACQWHNDNRLQLSDGQAGRLLDKLTLISQSDVKQSSLVQKERVLLPRWERRECEAVQRILISNRDISVLGATFSTLTLRAAGSLSSGLSPKLYWK